MVVDANGSADASCVWLFVEGPSAEVCWSRGNLVRNELARLLRAASTIARCQHTHRFGQTFRGFVATAAATLMVQPGPTNAPTPSGKQPLDEASGGHGDRLGSHSGQAGPF